MSFYPVCTAASDLTAPELVELLGYAKALGDAITHDTAVDVLIRRDVLMALRGIEADLRTLAGATGLIANYIDDRAATCGRIQSIWIMSASSRRDEVAFARWALEHATERMANTRWPPGMPGPVPVPMPIPVPVPGAPARSSSTGSQVAVWVIGTIASAAVLGLLGIAIKALGSPIPRRRRARA